jgi:hypothetical protein
MKYFEKISELSKADYVAAGAATGIGAGGTAVFKDKENLKKIYKADLLKHGPAKTRAAAAIGLSAKALLFGGVGAGIGALTAPSKKSLITKKAAFDPKRLIGPTLGAATLGLSGYAGAEKGKELPSAISSAVFGGIIGAGAQAWVRKLKEATKVFKSMGSMPGFEGGGTEDILQKSRAAIEALDRQQAKIKSHVATKSDFKYTDALKMTRQKRAAFLDIITGKKIKQLGELSKRYEKVLKHHGSKIDKAKETRNVSEALTAAGNSMRALGKLDEINYKIAVEKLKRIGVFGGTAVGVSAGVGAIAGDNKKIQRL